MNWKTTALVLAIATWVVKSRQTLLKPSGQDGTRLVEHDENQRGGSASTSFYEGMSEVHSSEGRASPVDAASPSASLPTSGAPNQAEPNASPLGAEVASNSSASTGSINQGEQLREQGLGMSVGGVGEPTVESTSGTVPTDQFTSESQLGEDAKRPGLPDLTRGA